ncbi:MAG: hypothetical protein ACE5IR_21895 [bacterium]
MIKEIVLKWRFPQNLEHGVRRAMLSSAVLMEDVSNGRVSKEPLKASAQRLREAVNVLDDATMPKLKFRANHLWTDTGPNGEVTCDICKRKALSRDLDVADKQGDSCREKYMRAQCLKR